MPFQRASSDVEPRHDDVVDPGRVQKPRKILSAVIRKAVADSQDPERVGIGRQGVIPERFLSFRHGQTKEQ